MIHAGEQADVDRPGRRVVAGIASWDNLTNKGLLRVPEFNSAAPAVSPKPWTRLKVPGGSSASCISAATTSSVEPLRLTACCARCFGRSARLCSARNDAVMFVSISGPIYFSVTARLFSS